MKRLRANSLKIIIPFVVILLAWLVWWQFGTKQFNADEAGLAPFAFEYPANWDGVYDDGIEGSVIVVLDERSQDSEYRYSRFFPVRDTAVFIWILTPEYLEEEYGNSQITPLEILQQAQGEQDAIWDAWHAGDIKEVERLIGFRIAPDEPESGLISVVNTAPFNVAQAIEPPHIQQLGGKDVAVTKQQMYSSFVMFSATDKRWDATFYLDDKLVRAVGIPDYMNDEDFEGDFYQIISSLDLTNSD